MNFLEERIVKDGVVKPGNVLKVDTFLNHQMDIELIDQMGAEFKKRFGDAPITKILTIEASGIGIAWLHVTSMFRLYLQRNPRASILTVRCMSLR
jgi:xanthine phosphoribosyltransferase